MSSGIYTIVNKENGKIYVGSTNNFERRWYEHRLVLRQGGHGNPHLQASWNWYGEDAFEFCVLEHVNNPEELVKTEQSWMDRYREEGKALYNVGLAVDCPWRGQERSEEHRRNIGRANVGRKNTEETKQQMSISAKARWARTKNRAFSEEHKYRISKSVTAWWAKRKVKVQNDKIQ